MLSKNKSIEALDSLIENTKPINMLLLQKRLNGVVFINFIEFMQENHPDKKEDEVITEFIEQLIKPELHQVYRYMKRVTNE